MFVVMAPDAGEAEILGVKSTILGEGLTPYDHVAGGRTLIAVIGELGGGRKPVVAERLGALPKVERVTPINRPFKLTSREFHPENTVIRILDAVIGDGGLTMMAGPCSVESREQLFETADAVKNAGATIEELLMAAEYIVAAGNPNVILCERGIRTFETYTRNTMDLAAVPVLHSLTHLPVIVDPSHATGKRWLVRPLALGGVAVGADGVMVEVHPDPDSALSDAEQQLDIPAFAALMADLLPVHDHVRGLHDGVPPADATLGAASGSLSRH
jgi:3-deoxy-D-arabino-heptulosonate 7-phosphate (DAHP) synthase